MSLFLHWYLHQLELKTGQLVKDEIFTLFEAVGALEVRHPYTRFGKGGS